MAKSTKIKKQSASNETVEGFQQILSTAKVASAGKKPLDASLFDSARPPLTSTYALTMGQTLTVKTDRGGTPVSLIFSSGRQIMAAQASGVYLDSTAPGVQITDLQVSDEGTLTYKRVMGKRSALMTETASGGKHAVLKVGRETREISLMPDSSKVIRGKEGEMTYAPDFSLVTLKPVSGGSIEIYPMVKLVAVQFPDGHRQSYYAGIRELAEVSKNPVGFYVNWLPTDESGHHFEWGTLALDQEQ